MKTQKKGFTLLELVIVIAVVAIMVAILLPTFAGIIQRSRLSNDIMLCKNLNTAAVTVQSDGKTQAPATMSESLELMAQNGFVVDKIKASNSDNIFVWDGANNRFFLYDFVKNNIIYKDDNTSVDLANKAQKVNCWIISETYEQTNDNLKGFSVYLKDNYQGETELNISTGIDVGTNFNIEKITYTNSGDTQSVVICTNGGSFVVDAANDTVIHHGFAAEGTVNNVDVNCYYENGTVGRLTYLDADGKIYFENGSLVYCYMNATADSSANVSETTKAENAVVYTYVDSGINEAKGYAAVDKEEVTVTNGIVEVSTCHNHNEDYDIINIGKDIYIVCKCCGGFSKISTDDNGVTIVLSSDGIDQENDNNFVAKNNEDLPIVNAVATINYEKYYSSLAAAVTDAVDNETITMLKNHETPVLSFSKTLTLDLNGKVVSGTTGMLLTFTGTGTFTVEDSSNNGTIIGFQVAVRNSGTGTIVINGGTLTTSATSKNYAIYNTSAGTVIVNDGYISGMFGIYNSSLDATIIVNGGEIKGGTKSGIFCYLGKGDVIVNGGTISSTSEYGITFSANSSYNSTGQGSLTVKGNSVISGTYGIFSGNPSTITISDNASVTGSGNYGIYLYNVSTLPASITVEDSAKIISNAKNSIYIYTTKAVNTVTINDKAEITGYTHGVYAYNGTINVNGGIIKTTIASTSSWSYGVWNYGTANINGGEIIATRVGVYESNVNGTININGGTISASECVMGKGTVNMTAGTLNAANVAIYDYNSSYTLVVNISGGTSNSNNYGVKFESTTSSLYMTDGKINAKYIGIYNNGTAEISGGEILVKGATNPTSTMAICNLNSVTINETESGVPTLKNENQYFKIDEDTIYYPYGIYAQGTDENKISVTINGGKISVQNGYALDLAYTDATITNGTLSGTNAIVSWTEDSTCTISGGSFTATGGQVCYANKGFFTISGGTFTSGGSSTYSDHIYRFTLNCLDGSYSADPATAGFTVTGGTFYQFNPQNDLSEGQNTCFTPEGYHSEFNEETGYYTVVAD